MHHNIIRYDAVMRTTVTLDADTLALVRQVMRERGVPFKQAVNDAIRGGLAPQPSAFRTDSVALGLPSVNLDRALAIAADLEDDELVRKSRIGK